MTCLENIIGLSRTECECLTADQPSGSDEFNNQSESGIYLDEIDGFNLNVAASAADCAKGSLWDIMRKAVDNSVEDFKTHLLGCINRKFKPRADNFSGQLGSSDFTSTLNISNSQCGIKITPNGYEGSYIYLNRIGVLINQSVNVTVKVYKVINYIATELGEFTTGSPVTANTLTWMNLGDDYLTLPAHDNAGKPYYYVLLQLDGTFQPKNNKRDCGCGGVKRPYLSWMDFRGTKGDSDFSAFRETSEINGLTLDVDIKCKQSELICTEERPLDFENDGSAREMAYAIRLKSAAKVYDAVLASGNINRYTLMNREKMEERVTEWNTEYAKWVEWFCGAINVKNNDCMICRDGKNIIKGNILA